MLLNETHDAAVTVLFILREHSLQIQFLIQHLHPGHLLSLLLSIILLQDLVLFRRGPLYTLNHEPAAFTVLDVSANLACHTGVPKEIKVIIPNLKELPHLQQDLLGIGMFLLPVNARHIHGSSYRKVEGVESCLILDDRFVPLFHVSAKIHTALRGCDEVQGLSNLSLVGTLQEELDQVQVIGLLPAVELQQLVDTWFQKNCITDGVQTDARLLIPADLTPSGEG